MNKGVVQEETEHEYRADVSRLEQGWGSCELSLPLPGVPRRVERGIVITDREAFRQVFDVSSSPNVPSLDRPQGGL